MELHKSILLELQYLPPVQYFSKLVAYQSILIEQHENYSKGTYRNRCHIAGANGIQRLSVPLKKGKNENQTILEVKIAYDKPWQSQHWHSIKSAYGNSPFFEYYAEDIKPFFKNKYENLFDFNFELLKCVISCLSIDCEVVLSKEFTPFKKNKDRELKNQEVFDFRNGIHPKKHRQKEDPLFHPQKYMQVFEEKHGFLPNLSILDLLFCTGPEAALILEQSVIKKVD